MTLQTIISKLVKIHQPIVVSYFRLSYTSKIMWLLLIKVFG